MQYFVVCTISQCAVMHHISLRLVRCRPGPAAAIILQATRPTAAKRQGRKDVTTLVRSIAAIERNLVKHGLAARCGRVGGGGCAGACARRAGLERDRMVEEENRDHSRVRRQLRQGQEILSVDARSTGSEYQGERPYIDPDHCSPLRDREPTCARLRQASLEWTMSASRICVRQPCLQAFASSAQF